MSVLLLAAIVLVCLLQRLSMVWNVRFSFDSWGHFYFLTAVKRQKTGPFAPIHVDVLAGGPFHYPLLTHWFLSFLPQAMLGRWIKAVNPMFETLGLAAYLALSVAAGLDAGVVAAAGLVYVFTPMLFSKVAIGSTSHFSTRLYSELSAGLLLLLAFLPLPLSGAVLVLLMVVLVAYIVLSSKFGLQMVLLLVLPAALLAWKPALLAGLVLGFASAVAVSQGGILKTWREQGRHLLWYLGETRKGKMPITDRNGLAPFREAFTAPSLKEKIVHFGFALAGRNSFSGLALKFPVAIAAALLVWSGAASGPVADNGVFALLGVAFFVYGVVNTTVFIILGEAERYLNHFAFLIVLVFTEWAFASGGLIWFWLALAWGVLYWLGELVLLGLMRLNQPREDEDGAYRALVEAAPAGSVVLAYPHHVMPPWRLLTTSSLRPVFPIIGTGAGTARLKAMESYPFIDLAHLGELRRDFGLAFVVTQDNKLDGAGQNRLEADGWQILPGDKNAGITLYRHAGGAGETASG